MLTLQDVLYMESWDQFLSIMVGMPKTIALLYLLQLKILKNDHWHECLKIYKNIYSSGDKPTAEQGQTCLEQKIGMLNKNNTELSLDKDSTKQIQRRVKEANRSPCHIAAPETGSKNNKMRLLKLS